MIGYMRTLAIAAVAAFGLSGAPAQAASIIIGSTTFDDADLAPYSIGYGDEFTGGVISAGAGGGGAWIVRFDALSDPIHAGALATVSNIVANSFTNLVMQWIAVSDDFLLAQAVVPETVIPFPPPFPSIGYTQLATVFTATGVLGGDDSQQYLAFTWDNSTAGATFDVSVAAAVPLPAGGLLLVGALGGLALLRRRKTA